MKVYHGYNQDARKVEEHWRKTTNEESCLHVFTGEECILIGHDTEPELIKEDCPLDIHLIDRSHPHNYAMYYSPKVVLVIVRTKNPETYDQDYIGHLLEGTKVFFKQYFNADVDRICQNKERFPINFGYAPHVRGQRPVRDVMDEYINGKQVMLRNGSNDLFYDGGKFASVSYRPYRTGKNEEYATWAFNITLSVDMDLLDACLNPKRNPIGSHHEMLVNLEKELGIDIDVEKFIEDFSNFFSFWIDGTEAEFYELPWRLDNKQPADL
jgi:lipoate-protein ligase A